MHALLARPLLSYLPASAGARVPLLATHLLEERPRHPTVQELLGHRDVTTTMIYTRVLNRGPAGIRSPADRMPIL